MSLTEDDNVVKTIPSDRADEPLHIPVLPGRLSRDRSIPDAHRSKPPDECSAIRAIAIANDVAWWLVPATGLSQLTGKPLGNGMGCHAYPQNLSARMSQDEKSIQQPKRDGRNDEHIHRRDGIGVIVKKGLPALRRWPPSLCHVFRHRRLADLNAKLEEFAVDPRCSPQRVCDAHLANELTNLGRCFWSAAARSRLPAPPGSQARAMPTDHRLRLEDF